MCNTMKDINSLLVNIVSYAVFLGHEDTVFGSSESKREARPAVTRLLLAAFDPAGIMPLRSVL